MKRLTISTALVLNLFLNLNIASAQDIKQSTIKENNLVDNEKKECNSDLKVTLDLNEKLFTFICWLNFVSDIKEKEIYPEQKKIKEYLSSLPKDFYEKNRKAYENFLPELPPQFLYRKNGLFTSTILYYSNPPEFKITKPIKNPAAEVFNSIEFLESDIIKEFYHKANIHTLWENDYKKVAQNLNSLFPKSIDKISHHDKMVKILTIATK